MPQNAESLLRLPSVKNRTGLSKSELYRRVQVGTFPKPIKVGSRAVAWVESDINSWIADCIDQNSEKRFG